MLTTTVLVFAQLILGAVMRHQHAGLAVPDFPLAYGKLWPPMDAAFVEHINQQRLAAQDYKPITAQQIGLHMAHRLQALAILILSAVVGWVARHEQGRGSLPGKVDFQLVCVGLPPGACRRTHRLEQQGG